MNWVGFHPQISTYQIKFKSKTTKGFDQNLYLYVYIYIWAIYIYMDTEKRYHIVCSNKSTCIYIVYVLHI